MGGHSSKEVQATVNSFRILERLVDADQPIGVTELADAVGLSKGVVHNHLYTLIELGYVRKTERAYRPSFGLLALGEGARQRLPLFDRVRRQVDNLAQVTGEVSTLFVEEGGRGICVYNALGQHQWMPDYGCGSRLPLHVNAPGKAILASLDQDHVHEIVATHGLSKLTDETTTDPETLAVELRKVRESGIAFCRGEQRPGVVSVSAPIDLSERAPAAAIGVCGPRERLTGRHLKEDIAGQIISAARSIRAETTR